MDDTALVVDPANKNQTQILSITPNDVPCRLRVFLRYLNHSDRWYLSIFNADTDEVYCRYVPVTASYDVPVDLLGPFQHKKIGSIFCVPAVESPATEDPGLDNLDEFQIVWTDNYTQPDDEAYRSGIY